MKELDKSKPLEASGDKFYPKQFFDHFLSENRPLLVRDYAKSWRATEYWSDKKYLGDQAANMVHLSSFGMRHGPKKEEVKKEENKKEFEKGSIKDLYEGEKAAQEEKAVQEETD